MVLTILICDMTNRIKEAMISSDADYLLNYLSSEVIKECIKEFRWQFLTALKNIARKKYLLAQTYLNYTREQLIQMLTWQVAIRQWLYVSLLVSILVFTRVVRILITNFLHSKNVALLW